MVGNFLRGKFETQINDRLSLQCTTKSVIPSPEGAWESPVIQMLSVVITGDCHGLQASLAMTVVFDINDRLAQQLNGCDQLSLITVIAKPVRRLVVAPKREARGSTLGVQSASCDAEHRAAL